MDLLKWKYFLNLSVGLMLSLLLTGCQQKTVEIIPKYNGNFNTMQIRSLWMLCSLNFRQKNPFLGQKIIWKACDCYSDTIREELTPEEVEGSEKLKIDLTQVLTERCNPKVAPINPT